MLLVDVLTSPDDRLSGSDGEDGAPGLLPNGDDELELDEPELGEPLPPKGDDEPELDGLLPNGIGLGVLLLDEDD